MINLGKCQPIGINNQGQVVGWYSRWHLFVIDPKDIDDDGSLDWFEPGPEKEVNLLINDLSGSHVSARFLPVGINDRGQILGEIMNPGTWEFRGYPFLLSPAVAADNQALIWFSDRNEDQMNDLLQPLRHSSNLPRAEGLAFSKDLSSFVTWHQNKKNDEPTTVHWRVAADGTAMQEQDAKAVTVGVQSVDDRRQDHRQENWGENLLHLLGR